MAKAKHYRPPSSYLSKDPEKRARQLANIDRSRDVPRKRHENSSSLRGDIIPFTERHFYIPETRKSVTLLEWEKDIFRGLFEIEPRPTLALLGMPKKSGKSTLAAIIALWVLVTKPMSETYLMGPDLAQGQLVVFDKICKAIRMNPTLRGICTVRTDRVEYGDSFIMVLPCSKTAAGLNPDLVIFDELWQFTTTEAQRAFDEMTTVPTKDMLTLIVTYAGYEDETDTPLYGLYERGISEEKDERFFFLWRRNYEDVPWVTEKYLATQKARLRENTYRRLHCNEWVSSEEAFIDADILDMCTHKSHSRGKQCRDVCIGLDVGYAHDCTAVAVVGCVEAGTLALIDHAIFVPPKKGILDLEKTFESLLGIYAKEYVIRSCYYDPYQAIRSAQELKKQGVPMREYPQTLGNCVQMSSTLQGLLKSGSLMLYKDKDVRQHLLNAKVKETPRGWRIVKATQAAKIDIAIALAMACQSAQDNFLLKGKASLIVTDYDLGYEDEDYEDEEGWEPVGDISGYLA
jgi:phage terminase large subunit-like protein